MTAQWPGGTAPDGAVVFTHNQRLMAARAPLIWDWLVDAAGWPRWYLNARSVDLGAEVTTLRPGLPFRWTTFGTRLSCQVVEFDPPYGLGWSWRCRGGSGYHGWRLQPRIAGTMVITEETQRGPRIARWHLLLAPLLRLSHAEWLRALDHRTASTMTRGPDSGRTT